MKHKKHANIFKRPPKICLMCGPADKMAVVPMACERCHYRAAADENVAQKIAHDITTTEKAAQMTWEVIGRCLDDLNRKCPCEVFDKEIYEWICKGLPCEIEIDRRGEEIHPHWRCWAAWLGHEMASGSYSLISLEARRMMMEKKKAADEKGEIKGRRKENPEQDPS